MLLMRKVLLADDEAYVTSVLSSKLASRFDEVIVASDGDEAFELAVAEGPLLVVSDYQMPGCDGYTLATRLREDPRTAHIPIILLTARGHLLSDEQVARTSIVRMLAKPFSIREVVAAVDEVTKGLMGNGKIGPAITARAA
jgi:two-component system alkaline phosphatase synthesis response regulator PhoP